MIREILPLLLLFLPHTNPSLFSLSSSLCSFPFPFLPFHLPSSSPVIPCESTRGNFRSRGAWRLGKWEEINGVGGSVPHPSSSCVVKLCRSPCCLPCAHSPAFTWLAWYPSLPGLWPSHLTLPGSFPYRRPSCLIKLMPFLLCPRLLPPPRVLLDYLMPTSPALVWFILSPCQSIFTVPFSYKIWTTMRRFFHSGYRRRSFIVQRLVDKVVFVSRWMIRVTVVNDGLKISRHGAKKPYFPLKWNVRVAEVSM